jgi:hypothetical protein
MYREGSGRIRKPLLYPAELRDQAIDTVAFSSCAAIAKMPIATDDGIGRPQLDRLVSCVILSHGLSRSPSARQRVRQPSRNKRS